MFYVYCCGRRDAATPRLYNTNAGKKAAEAQDTCASAMRKVRLRSVAEQASRCYVYTKRYCFMIFAVVTVSADVTFTM